MKDTKVLGIDLAKSIFQLHGNDAKGKQVLTKRLTREKMIEFLSQIKPCTIGIETTVKILRPDKKGYMWAYHSLDPKNRFIVFEFDLTRAAFVPSNFR